MKYRPKAHQQPSWSIKGSGNVQIPIEPSRWEKFLLAEGIDEQDCKGNPKVMQFVKEHADRFYVPTKVLKMFGVRVEG